MLDRIRALKDERVEAQTALSEVEQLQRAQAGIDVEEACALLDALPDLREALATAEPELRRRVYEAFRLAAEIDRNAGQIRLKALVSSAFTEASDLEDLVASGSIAGARRRFFTRDQSGRTSTNWPLERRVTSVDAFSGGSAGFWLCEPVRVRVWADVVLTFCNA